MEADSNWIRPLHVWWADDRQSAGPAGRAGSVQQMRLANVPEQLVEARSERPVVTQSQLDLLPEAHVGQIIEVADSDLEATLVRLERDGRYAASMEMVTGSLSRWRLELASGNPLQTPQAPVTISPSTSEANGVSL